MLPNKTPEMEGLLPMLSHNLVRLLLKNCKSRILLSLEATQQKEEMLKLENEDNDD